MVRSDAELHGSSLVSSKQSPGFQIEKVMLELNACTPGLSSSQLGLIPEMEREAGGWNTFYKEEEARCWA